MEALISLRNRTREEAFSSLRKVKRLLFLHNVQREGDSYLKESREEKKKCDLLFRKWKALEGRLKEC
jgi:uncharacterized Zn finger protein